MNTMNHKGYTARIEFDERDNIFVGRVLGLLGLDAAHWFRLAKPASPAQAVAAAAAVPALTDGEVEAQIAARVAARRARNWAESDRIRDTLAAAGVILEDQPGGTTSWRRA